MKCEKRRACRGRLAVRLTVEHGAKSLERVGAGLRARPCYIVRTRCTLPIRRANEVKRQTSNVKRQTSNVKRQTSNVKRQTSNVKRQTSNVKRQTLGNMLF
jgi:hypothetical protein